MHPDQRSRRRLLAGVLSTLLGWLWIRTTPAAAPPPVTAPPRPGAGQWVVVTIYSTDRHGRRQQVCYEYPVDAPPAACSYACDTQTGVTIVTRPG
jgi:hypothetical protein